MAKMPEYPMIEINGSELAGGYTKLFGNTKENQDMGRADVASYESEVAEQLRTLRGTRTGWCILTEIFMKAGRSMAIKPLVDLDRNWNLPTNAFAGPADPLNATPAGKRLLACSDSPDTKTSGVLPGNFVGTGAGSDVLIRYSPGTWKGSAADKPGSDGPEILFHEMCHGVRQMNGKMYCSSMADNPGYDTYEEFFAIVVSNMYRSEKGLTTLRQDHHGFNALPAPLTDPEQFLKDGSNLDHIQKAAEEDPKKVLINNLANVACRFNPFKVFRDRYPQLCK
ncbi:MAG: M91 family zinc metallopeptidase [Gemmataceae bacterium]